MPAPIHDRGYQLLFSNPVIFRQLLETFVDAPWVRELDFSRCEKLNKSFISKEYEKRESDLIYKVYWRGQSAYIVVLIEFQSTVQRFMAVRVWRYLAEFYTDWIETQRPGMDAQLPPIFPIVLYNGDETWTAPENIADLIQHNELFGEFAIHFKYFKLVENEFTVEKLLRIRNIVSTLFLAEIHYDRDLLLNELLLLFRHEDRAAVSLFINWFKQLYRHGRLDEQDYREFETCYHNEAEVNMLIKSLYKDRDETFQQGKLAGLLEGQQQGKLEGKIEGKIEGQRESQCAIARSMLAEGLESPLIAKMTGLTLDEINQLIHH